MLKISTVLSTCFLLLLKSVWRCILKRRNKRRHTRNKENIILEKYSCLEKRA